ncbi:hypothetical protein PAXRUDRAFT_836563, partial [Paxillus rubicundulus Ve08.2h10]
MTPAGHFRPHPLVYGITRPSLAPPAHLFPPSFMASSARLCPHPLIYGPTCSFIPPAFVPLPPSFRFEPSSTICIVFV